MKLLITGGLGFIGRTLAEELLEKTDYEIYIIDIREFPSELKNERMHFYKIDVCEKGKIDSIFKSEKFDGVVHLAAVSRVEDAEKDKEKCVRINYGGTKTVVEAAQKIGAWMIFGSSREVYGEQKIFPVKEDAELCPLNVYGHTKLEGELLVQTKIENYIIMRFSNVYGNSYDRVERVIPIFVRNALKGEDLVLHGGEQVIDFTFIGDTVRTICKGIELLNTHTQNNESLKETIHVSPGKENRLKDIANFIVKITGAKSKVIIDVGKKRNYDVVKFIGNSNKRKSLLIDEEFICLEDGLKEYLKTDGCVF